MDAKEQPMDKEEETQLEGKVSEIRKIAQENKTGEEENKSKDIIPDSEQSLAKAEEQEITESGTDINVAVKESGAEAAKEPAKEETKETELPDPSIALTATDEAPKTVAEETTDLVKEEPADQSDVASDSTTLVLGTGVSSVTPNSEEAKAIEQVKEGPTEPELPETLITATAVSESLAEDRQVELVKEDIKEAKLPDATPVVVSDAKPVAETTEETKDAEPAHEEENKALELIYAPPATETVNESADLIPETKLPDIQTAGLLIQLPDTSDAATGEVENKETELVKEEIKEFEFPDSSVAVTPVVDAELIPETTITETAEVSEVHTEKEKALDESEVSEALPEKRKKRALGDHLAEEKVNDSIKANYQASVEKPEAELPKEEQIASAIGPKESTEVSSRDVNITHDTKTEADEKKEDNEHTGGVTTTTEAAPEGESEKHDKKESVAAGEAAKEEVVSKPTSRSSNNILSKVKHQIVKVKKAIVKRSPSLKNMPMENKDDIKVK